MTLQTHAPTSEKEEAVTLLQTGEALAIEAGTPVAEWPHTEENFRRAMKELLDRPGTIHAAQCRAWIADHHRLNETREETQWQRRRPR